MKPSEHKAQIMAILIAGIESNPYHFHMLTEDRINIAEMRYNLIMARCQTLPAPADTEDSDAQA